MSDFPFDPGDFPLDPVDGTPLDPWNPHRHPVPDKGVELGHKSTLALLLIASAGGVDVSIYDLDPSSRRFLEGKGHLLDSMALVTTEHPPVVNGRAGKPRYTLTALGRDMVDLIQASMS